jgi:hypothetical protein
MFAREGGFSSSRRVKADASGATTETSAPGDFLPVGWFSNLYDKVWILVITI